MNHNLCLKPLLNKRNNEKNIYIADAKYDLCGIGTQMISVKCDGGYHLAITDVVGKA